MSAKVSLIGYIAKEPEVKYLDSGKVLWRTSVPIQSTTKNAEGEYPTTWYQLVAWGELAQRLADNSYPDGNAMYGKGAYVQVLGALQVKTYTAGDGTEKTQLEVTVASVDRVRLKSTNSDDTSPSSSTATRSKTTTATRTAKPVAPVEDDVPF